MSAEIRVIIEVRDETGRRYRDANRYGKFHPVGNNTMEAIDVSLKEAVQSLSSMVNEKTSE